MNDWDLTPPPSSPLGDHDVDAAGDHLRGKRVALLLTGGIATMRGPFMARALRRQGADVVAFTTPEALRYTTEDALCWATTHRVVTRLSPSAEHLSDASPFDAYLLPAATYNTINKLRHGIADNVVTSALASALGRMERGQAAVLLAPAMHGTMHNRILTDSLTQLRELGVRIVPPLQEAGKDKAPSDDVLVAEVCRATSRSALRGVTILVTGGPTPVPIDAIRRITNRFQGKLGAEIAMEAHLRGADVLLVHGQGTYEPPSHLPHVIAKTYDEYLEAVSGNLKRKLYRYGVFSAAVADYRPETTEQGKIPSGDAERTLRLVPTQKVIELVHRAHPELYMVTFKYEEGLSHDALLAIAHKRIQAGYPAVVANRGDEWGDGEQVAWLVSGTEDPVRMVGKPAIARAVVDHLERVQRPAAPAA